MTTKKREDLKHRPRSMHVDKAIISTEDPIQVDTDELYDVLIADLAKDKKPLPQYGANPPNGNLKKQRAAYKPRGQKFVDPNKIVPRVDNPFIPKADEIVKDKYGLHSKDLLTQMQYDFLATLKVLMDQAYTVGDIRGYTASVAQASVIMQQIQTAKNKKLTAEETQEFADQVQAFNDRIKNYTPKQ